ncbi:MAG TPA: hypothetical protein VI454_11230 [Verrucomicrobiae bacterium]
MKRFPLLPIFGLASWLAMTSSAHAQGRPYIGFVYPAGGQQGTTFQIKVGGQGLEDVNNVIVTGTGVKARVLEYYRRLTPQDMTLLREQMGELRRASKGSKGSAGKDEATQLLKTRIEKRMTSYVNRPACVSIANIAIIEVTMAPDAKPGEREIRLGTPSGVSNPMMFHVGQLPEISRKPMNTCEVQVLGKEAQALRKRPAEEAEVSIKAPCTVNGQIASGDVDRYRFEAREGQRLVISALGRQLIPYIADAVPGWIQPVLALYDTSGKQVAYDDDFRFKPDPTIFYEVPKDGEYVFEIHDSIYRGREDFVYRITIGELPFVTSIFPLGGRVGDAAKITMKGWNLDEAELTPPAGDAGAGIQLLAAKRKQVVSNRVPFALDRLPDCAEVESNNDPAHAQKVALPIIVNGRIDKPDDWDVFEFAGRKGETIVAEVFARRLDSPLDSILKITDAAGAVLAFNDDREDAGAGVNTHHADSYLMVTLPADGKYYAHLGDTARSGGEEYGYRLRISTPQPDFALRVVPSSVSLRGKSSANVSIHVIRKDGFTGPISVSLMNAPMGISSSTVSLTGTQQVAQLTLRAAWAPAKESINFSASIAGTARIEGRDVVHEAVPAEDRMQAFLWRHLVPATELRVEIFNQTYKLPPKRVPLMPTALAVQAKIAATGKEGDAPKFTKRQVASRLRDLKLLFEEGLLTNEFYVMKVAECEAAR